MHPGVGTDGRSTAVKRGCDHRHLVRALAASVSEKEHVSEVDRLVTQGQVTPRCRWARPTGSAGRSPTRSDQSRRRSGGQRCRVPRMSGRDREVGDLAASLTALSEEALHLKRSTLVRCGRIDELETRPSAPTSSSHSSAFRAEYPTSRSQMLPRASSPAIANGSTTWRTSEPPSRLTALVSSRNLSATLQHDRQGRHQTKCPRPRPLAALVATSLGGAPHSPCL